ncbi:efflux RND transporter permease subunit [Candidatus Uabimicrobium sp. HlEnr_7]|uniref:efflux RND transporter permease subunit n=1 Tax=Candidatus Uabimicrobium helgolandensis TaxID=3095367 RepID=UPI003556312D
MIRFFAERSVPANLLFIILLVAGIFFSLALPVESIPNISLGVVAVYTPWPGASAEDVEKLLTTKIEEQLENLDHVLWIKSFSTQGLSRIHIKFSEDLHESVYDELYLKTQSEVEKITSELPEDAETSVVELVDFSMIRPTIVIALGGNMPEKSRNEIANELKENLLQIPGMSKVRIRGEREQRIIVKVNREQTEKYKLSILDIMDSIRKESSTFPGGILRLENSEIVIRTLSDRRNLQELRTTVIRSYADGSLLRLEDVADLSWAYEKWKTIYRVQGTPATFLYCVKEDTENALTIIPIIKEEVAKFRSKLPIEIYCEFFKDNVLYVNRVLSVLKSNLSLGLVLVFLLLWICIGTSNAILAVIGIPFAFLCAMIFLSWTGNTLNEMVLVSLVLVSGMVVDDAIIILENMYRHYQETGQLLSSAICGASEVFWPVISATATTIAAFLPMLLMTGLLGKIMSIVPKTVSITLAASLIEAFLILPNHFTDLGKVFSLANKPQVTYQPGFFVKFYLSSLRVFLNHRYIMTLSFLITFVCGFVVLIYMFPISIILFPSDHHDFWVTAKVHEGAHIEYTEKKIKDIEKILETIPKDEIMNYVVQVGRSMDENYQLVLDKSVAQFTVTLNPDRKTQRTTNEIIRSVRTKMQKAQLQGFTSIDVNHTPNGPQQGKPVAVIIRGNSLKVIGEIRDIIKSKLSQISGVTDIKDDMQALKYQLSIHFKDEELKRYKIDRSFIAQTITAAVEGSEISEMNYHGKQYKIYVQYNEKDIHSIRSIREIRLRIPSGQLIRVDDVAYLSYKKTLAQIPHHNSKRAVTVTANIEKPNTSLSVNNELQQYLTSKLKKYPGYICEFGGEYEETNRSFRALKISFIIAMLLVYMILGTQFNSFAQPLIIMSIIPFTMIGVGYGLALFNLPFTMLTFMSTIGMIGIVVNDSLVLIDFINREVKHNQDTMSAVLVACRKRLRPIILTTLTTVLGLLPLALGIGGSSITWSPMATAFSWGLTLATILTLYVIPALYLILVDMKIFFRFNPQLSNK